MATLKITRLGKESWGKEAKDFPTKTTPIESDFSLQAQVKKDSDKFTLEIVHSEINREVLSVELGRISVEAKNGKIHDFAISVRIRPNGTPALDLDTISTSTTLVGQGEEYAKEE